MTLLMIVLLAAVGYMAYLMMTNRPLPFMPKQNKKKVSARPRDKVPKKNMPINELLGYLKVSRNLIWLPNNYVVAVLKCDKVNYALDSLEEQAIVDQALIRWLTAMEGDVSWYLQSRRLDLSSKMEEYDRMIEVFRYENPKLADYGRGLKEYLRYWQRFERYEVHRYLLIKKQIPEKLLGLEQEELEERIWADMERRANSHKAALERIGVRSTILNDQGIKEMMYFALNRGLISNTRYAAMVSAEHASIYSTTSGENVKYIKEEGDGEVANVETLSETETNEIKEAVGK